MNTLKLLNEALMKAMRTAPRNLMAVGSVLLVAGCASSGTPKSAGSLPKVDSASLKKMQEQILDESKNLRDVQQKLHEGLVRRNKAVPLPLEAPKFDPLESKTISIKMNHATINQLVAALADQAQLNLIVDPQVLAMDKRADLNLKNVSVREAINSVLQAFDLHGEIKGHTLVISLLEERIFSLDFLNASTSLNISAGGDVFGSNTGSGTGSSSGSSSGSSNTMRGNLSLSGGASNKGDPYDQIENAVKRIIGTVQPREANDKDKKSENPVDEVDVHTLSTYNLDKLSGTLYVKARPSEVASIAKLIKRTQQVFGRQVEIEAQLVDVQLSDGFQLGVDWKLLRNQVMAGYGSSPITISSSSTTTGSTGSMSSRTVTIPEMTVGSSSGTSFGLGFSSNSVSAALSALRSFGSVKVLSNPSVQVRNGTPALLSVGTNTRYISKTSTTVTATTSTTTSSDVQTDSVFAGVMIGVVPFIRDDGHVELMVHPMQTDVDSDSLNLVDAGNGSKVTLPVVNYKGMTTTLNVRDGDTVLIGGLIDQKTSNEDDGAPGLSDIPLLGWAFGSKSDSRSARELVIVMHVRVL